jgi:hypothetical protein
MDDTNRIYTLAQRPTGKPDESTFELVVARCTSARLVRTYHKPLTSDQNSHFN